MPNQLKSKDPNTLAEALALFQKQVKTANREGTAKDRGNRERKYSTLEDLLKALEPALELGLSHSQTFEYLPLENEVLTILVTTLFFKEEKLESKLPLRDPKNPNVMHALGTAITYSRRYALGAIYGIGSEEDDDAMSLNQKEVSSQPKITRTPRVNGQKTMNNMVSNLTKTPIDKLKDELAELPANQRSEVLQQFQALRFPNANVAGNLGLFGLIKTQEHIQEVQRIIEEMKSDSP